MQSLQFLGLGPEFRFQGRGLELLLCEFGFHLQEFLFQGGFPLQEIILFEVGTGVQPGTDVLELFQELFTPLGLTAGHREFVL